MDLAAWIKAEAPEDGDGYTLRIARRSMGGNDDEYELHSSCEDGLVVSRWPGPSQPFWLNKADIVAVWVEE